MGRTQVFKVVTSVEAAEHLGCPLTSTTDSDVDWVKKLVLRNRSFAICEVANVTGHFICFYSEHFERL